jgi:hypothetical protein
MSFKEQARHFFAMYNNGDVFFFTIYKNGEIYCKEINKQYTANTGKQLPAAATVEFTKNNFELKSITGETIYSLEYYHHINGTKMDESLRIEEFYIDLDVRQEILDKEKITFGENLTHIPGLLDEVELKVRTRKRSPNRK